MDFSMARSERITAVISTIVAVAVLAGGVTAYQARTAPIEDIVQLESDFRFQLEVGFLHNHKERAARLEQLKQVTTAWRESQQTDADRTKLADWLLEATIRSMAGSTEALPPVPTFGTTDTTEDTPAGDARNDLDVIAEPESDATFTPAVEPPTPAAPTPASASPADTTDSLDEFGASAAESLPTEPVVAAPLFRPRAAPPVVAVMPEPTTPVVPIRVNLSELAARIAGYHTGLDEVERSIAQLSDDDLEALAAQVRELKQLTHDYRFVSMYYRSLDDAERRWVEEPRGLSKTLAALQRRIDQAQAARAGDFLGDFDANTPDRIGVLRQQVAELTSLVSR